MKTVIPPAQSPANLSVQHPPDNGNHADLSAAIVAFKNRNRLLAVLGIADPQKCGNEHHAACPLCAATAGDGGTDRLHIHDLGTEHERAACRRCEAAGDALWWTMKLAGNDPDRRGAVAEFLRDRGFLAGKKSRKSKGHQTLDAAIYAALYGLRKKHPNEWIRDTAKWPYRDAAGKMVAVVVRFDIGADGQKEFRPIHRDEKSKAIVIGDPPGKWTLFRLPQLAAEIGTAPRVFVVEGEKATDFARSIGLTATTSAHGAQCPEKTDWTPLAVAREVVILPDNDDAGEKYAVAVARLIRGTNPDVSVKILRLPGLEPKGDVADFIADRKAEGVETAQIRAEIEWLAKTEAVEAPKELPPSDPPPRTAPSRSHDLFGNVEIVDFSRDGRPVYGARRISEIGRDVLLRLPHLIFRLGDNLFVPKPDAGVQFLPKHADLFAHLHREIGAVSWRTGADSEEKSFVTKPEFFAHMKAIAPAVDEIVYAPHSPEVPGVYYAHEPLPKSTGGRALAGLLDFYSPASPTDEAILRAMLRTLAWGGPGGKRPLFIIYCAGQQETGKTSVIETASQLVGGFQKMQPGNKRETLSGQLLSHEGRQYRVALLDNVTGAMRSAEIAELLTAGRITGESKYLATCTRPNLVTWVMTTNTPDLSTDLASRAFILRIKPADKDARPNWFSEISAYIAERRGEILADLLAELRDESSAAPIEAKRSRFPEWDEQVLNRGPLAHLASQVLAGRLRDIREHDGESDELEAFEALMAALANGDLRELGLPDREEIASGLRAEQIAAVWNRATGEKRGTQSVARHVLRPAIDRGKLAWLDRHRTKRWNLWRVSISLLCLAAAPDGNGETVEGGMWVDSGEIPPSTGQYPENKGIGGNGGRMEGEISKSRGVQNGNHRAVADADTDAVAHLWGIPPLPPLPPPSSTRDDSGMKHSATLTTPDHPTRLPTVADLAELLRMSRADADAYVADSPDAVALLREARTRRNLARAAARDCGKPDPDPEPIAAETLRWWAENRPNSNDGGETR